MGTTPTIESGQAQPRPVEFAHLLLNALDLSATKSRRRKRDQRPDEAGLAIKQALLRQIVLDDPDPLDLGDWLLDQVLASTVSGAARAMASEILEEYRLAAADPEFARWLSHGATEAAVELRPEESSGGARRDGHRPA